MNAAGGPFVEGGPPAAYNYLVLALCQLLAVL